MRVFICVCVVASATWSAITCCFGPHIFLKCSFLSKVSMSFQRSNVGQHMVSSVAMSIAPPYHLSAEQEETDSTTVRQWLSQVRNMQRFLMLSVVALIGVSHAVNLSDAVAESERWEHIRHVAVEAIPRINAGGLVAKRALLECIATVSEPDAAEVSSHLEMIPVTFLRWLCVF